MPPEAIERDWRRDGLADLLPRAWRMPLVRLAAAWLVLFAVTFGEWREMAHQWWDIDTYSHILLVPPIFAWLVWLRRGELARVVPAAWAPGLVWTVLGLLVWLGGRAGEVNLIAQTGAIITLQGAVMAQFGLRASLLLAFPLAYAAFLVPFGDEIIPALQVVTAKITVALTHLSGVDAAIDGIYIDTPAGLFIVAEACSGVKFLIAMVALAVLVAWTALVSWKRRALFVFGCVVTSIVANGIRAWGTIYVAQYVGVEKAGSFDHIVYGWIFFAVVIAALLAVAWRWFEREPHEAGYSASELDGLSAMRLGRYTIAPGRALALTVAAAIVFAVAAGLG